jgi:hypothetical protein
MAFTSCASRLPSASWSGFTSVTTNPPNRELPQNAARQVMAESNGYPRLKWGKLASG